ncbi:MAG TPA: SDR family oxidoreductase [Longimicrobiales bacterium]
MLGIGLETGAALLLYTERGFLGTAGFLFALGLAALAVGIWVGAEPAGVLKRWLGAIIAFALAGIFAMVWTRLNGARLAGWSGALAALFLLAEPAYTGGALLSSLAARYRSVSASALLGAAFGILLASLFLIPRLSAGVIFEASAIVLTIVAIWDVSRTHYPLMNNSLAMTNKVALITGVGSAGQVGYFIAQRMIEAGARVCITGMHEDVHELARELGNETLSVQADLTDTQAVTALLDQVQGRFERLDVLVNVAGGLSVIKALGETETEEWRRELQRNAETAFAVTRAALPLLRASRGAVVNFAAPAGLRAQARLGAYSAAKAAVVALTRALALEEKGNGVRANALAPGMIDTEQNRAAVADPQSVKWVSRDQIADVVLFLASDAASGITGETIHVLGEGIT